jgi:ribosomal protein S18 acetylase RimI-like enzyme
MDTIWFRNYTKSDYEALKVILQEGKLYDSIWDSEEILKKRSLEKPDTIILAVVGKEVVGCVYVVDDMLPLIFRLAVKEKFRSKGIGKQLIKESIARMKVHGHTEITLFADSNDVELKNWYRKQGFTQSKSSWIGFWKKI